MRAVPTLTLHSVRSSWRGIGAVSTQLWCEMSQQQTFEIIEVETRDYSRFNTRGTQWKVRLNPPPPTTPPDPVSHFIGSVKNLFECGRCRYGWDHYT